LGNNRNDQYIATLMTTATLTASENQILVFSSPGGGKGHANGQIIAQSAPLWPRPQGLKLAVKPDHSFLGGLRIKRRLQQVHCELLRAIPLALEV
jgi:hypothetical protein